MLPANYAPAIPPFNHQKDALVDSWDKEGYAFLLEMGLGKSRVTIDNFSLLYMNDMCDAIFVLAPKSVYMNWTRTDDDNPGEFQKWLWPKVKENMRMHSWRAGKMKQDAKARLDLLDAMSPGPRILAMNIEALSATDDAFNYALKFLRSHRCMMVIDESTIIKNPTAVRTKRCLKLAPMATYRRILTGSPSTGSPSDLFAQFEFLGPGKALLGARLYTLFRARYCIMKEITVPGRAVPVKIEVGVQNIDELSAHVAKHSYRRRKKDCLDLPPKVYMPPRPVELTPEQKQAYDELRKHAMTVVRDAHASGQPAEVTTQIVITQLLRMHQVMCGHVKTDDGRILELPSNRLKVMMEVIEDTDESVIIWCKFRPDAAKIAKELRRVYGENSVAEWHGGISQAQREAGEADLQNGRKRFMVSTSAGARGRTWTRATLSIYYCNDPDLETRLQSEDRNHRIGTTGPVTYIDLVVPNSLDEKIAKALRAKKNIASAVLQEGIEAWI
jgi:SNF2 family DNA or RNA helicase